MIVVTLAEKTYIASCGCGRHSDWESTVSCYTLEYLDYEPIYANSETQKTWSWSRKLRCKFGATKSPSIMLCARLLFESTKTRSARSNWASSKGNRCEYELGVSRWFSRHSNLVIRSIRKIFPKRTLQVMHIPGAFVRCTSFCSQKVTSES